MREWPENHDQIIRGSEFLLLQFLRGSTGEQEMIGSHVTKSLWILAGCGVLAATLVRARVDVRAAVPSMAAPTQSATPTPAAAPAPRRADAAPSAPTAPDGALVRRYCVGCHNDRLKT